MRVLERSRAPCQSPDPTRRAALPLRSAAPVDATSARTLSKRALIGPAVQILTAMHPLDAALRRKQEYGKPVEIGSDVWVGAGAFILPGVSIGSGAVIGAGSVVTRDVPAGVFAAGNLCPVIREITADKRGSRPSAP